MRRMFGLQPVLALALALLALPRDLAAQDAERFSISGNAVAVYNIAGEVRLEPGTGANVVVEVTRGGADGAKLTVDRGTVDGRAGLMVRYPDRTIVYRGRGWNGNTSMQVRSDGTFFGKGSRGSDVRIRSSGSGSEAHADLRILVPAGKSVFVRLGVGSVRAANIDGALDIDVAAASVQTSRTRGALRIDTGSGSVRVTDAEGDVTVDTGSGAINLATVRGDEVRLDTGSGAVSGTDITTKMLYVDTGSGSIELARVAARDIELDTGSGRVELDLTTDVERLLIDTGSGGVRLTIPESLGAALEVDTGSGGITVDVPVEITRRSRSHLVGKLGDGRGSIEIDTGSGGVVIRRR